MPHDFPTIVYRCPGAWPGPPGTTYSSVGVEDAEQLHERLAAGWHLSIPEAVEAHLSPAPVVEAVVGEVVESVAADADDNAPPTREEMLAQAALLGLKVDKRWSDETLLAKINAAMAPAADDPI